MEKDKTEKLKKRKREKVKKKEKKSKREKKHDPLRSDSCYQFYVLVWKNIYCIG